MAGGTHACSILSGGSGRGQAKHSAVSYYLMRDSLVPLPAAHNQRETARDNLCLALRTGDRTPLRLTQRHAGPVEVVEQRNQMLSGDGKDVPELRGPEPLTPG